MIRNLDEFLVGIAIGIRFRSNFAIEDNLGNIIDRILYSKNAFFTPKVFPKAYDEGTGKTLANDKNGNSLQITSSNIILEIIFGEDFSLKDLATINKKFNEQIIEGAMKELNITQINRTGYIMNYLFPGEELAKNFIGKTIGNTLEGVNDIQLRFSKKQPELESIAKKDINDFYNVIFNVVKRADKKELFISVDYQKCFDPFLETVAQLEFSNFLQKVESYNSKTFITWLNENYGSKNE